MCEFISSEVVMPGYVCCTCRNYNGLQRMACKDCGMPRHPFEIPASVRRCESCKIFHYEPADEPKFCPCCKASINPNGVHCETMQSILDRRAAARLN